MHVLTQALFYMVDGSRLCPTKEANYERLMLSDSAVPYSILN